MLYEVITKWCRENFIAHGVVSGKIINQGYNRSTVETTTEARTNRHIGPKTQPHGIVKKPAKLIGRICQRTAKWFRHKTITVFTPRKYIELVWTVLVNGWMSWRKFQYIFKHGLFTNLILAEYQVIEKSFFIQTRFRITSYNVCYTKLLRFLTARPSKYSQFVPFPSSPIIPNMSILLPVLSTSSYTSSPSYNFV